jgi:electron transport complex protein RnfG
MKDALKLVLILFLVCGIAAGSLAFVNKATQAQIAEYARIARLEAQKMVFPDADEFVETGSYTEWESKKYDVQAGSVYEWKAMKDGGKIGSVFQTSIQGYSGIVKIIFGVDLKGAITGTRVLLHTETPGLGAKISTGSFLDQFAGKTAEQVALKKDDPSKGAIDAISAATISSRAVTKAIRQAMEGTAVSAASTGESGGK